jgi:hypothetical protein
MVICSGMRIEGGGEGGPTSNITSGIGFCIYFFKIPRKFDPSDARRCRPGGCKVVGKGAKGKSCKVRIVIGLLPLQNGMVV